jgi:hypothetical protein
VNEGTPSSEPEMMACWLDLTRHLASTAPSFKLDISFDPLELYVCQGHAM